MIFEIMAITLIAFSAVRLYYCLAELSVNAISKLENTKTHQSKNIMMPVDIVMDIRRP